MKQTIVIGAGITGLTTALYLRKAGLPVLVLEGAERAGGQIRTLQEGGYTFETGPNTGSISFPEVAELFALLPSGYEAATPAGNCRYIYKKGKLHRLPSGPLSGLTTSLFTLGDKFRLLGEPWREKGNDPYESVGSLAKRRLGKSFLQYAVDPFVGGIYAGDPMKLETRHALPKLYNLEQKYGSFIRGAMAKAKEPKSDRDRLATKEVYSARQGLETMIHEMVELIGTDNIRTGATVTSVRQGAAGDWLVTYQQGGELHEVPAERVVSTVGAHALASFLGETLPDELLSPITSLYYAPIVEVAVGFDRKVSSYHGFGALMPSSEPVDILGVLFPSDCFADRTPTEGGVLYSIFMGGTRYPDLIDQDDETVRALALRDLYKVLRIDPRIAPDMVHISRHRHAIPQYGADSEKRCAAIAEIERRYPGLIIAGNCRDGIGMANRITQATQVAQQLIAESDQ